MSTKTITVEVWQTRAGIIDHIAQGTPAAKEYAENEGYKQLNQYQMEVTEPEQKRPLEWWLEPLDNGDTLVHDSPGYKAPEQLIHVIEKLPGSVLVTREQLAKAWDNKVAGGPVEGSPFSVMFQGLCRAIGLEDKS